jgi:hypothetical protein
MKVNVTRELDHNNVEAAKKWAKKSPEDLEVYILERIKAKEQAQLIVEMASIIAALTKNVKL